MNYKVVMAYDGSRYNGWQKQGNTDKTIQGKLEQILFKMTGEEFRPDRCRSPCQGPGSKFSHRLEKTGSPGEAGTGKKCRKPGWTGL